MLLDTEAKVVARNSSLSQNGNSVLSTYVCVLSTHPSNNSIETTTNLCLFGKVFRLHVDDLPQNILNPTQGLQNTNDFSNILNDM